MKIKIILTIVVAIYGLICSFLYFAQEKLLFHPTVLAKDHVFAFKNDFEEINLKTKDNILLNALHFKAESPKGAVLFLHGNGGSIDGWGQTSPLYTNSGYDVVYLDYRGFGKSEGKINGEKALISDAQLAYDYLKKHFDEKDIILSGTSIGTGMATIIAAQNNPKKLILNSPYFSLASLINEKIKIAPKLLMKYKLETNKHLSDVKCPVFILHGNQDQLIPIQHALDLKVKHQKVDLTILKGYGHNDILQSPEYLQKTIEILK